MRCVKARQWLWSHGVGELTPLVEIHIAGCPECRAVADEVRLLDQTVGQGMVPDPGDLYWEEFPTRVASRIAAGAAQTTIRVLPVSPRRRWAYLWAPALGVAVLAVLIGREVILRPVTWTVSESEVPVIRTTPAPHPDQPGSSSAIVEPNTTAPATSDNWSGAKKGSDKARSTSATGAGSQASQSAHSTQAQESVVPNEKGSASSTSSNEAVSTRPTVPVNGPAIGGGNEDNEVWPHRQVTIMGKIASDTPGQPVNDSKRSAQQDPYGKYERQMAQGVMEAETATVSPTPGRLLEAPRQGTVAGFAESYSPAEAMRRFDEIAGLRKLIGNLQSIDRSQRSDDDRSQLCALWFRLGMISDKAALVDSAVSVVGEYLNSLDSSSAGSTEWAAKKDRLRNRRQSMTR
ncbi:MAG: hypothetical protein HY304_06645 [candidate division Zixibacteria bacterium]|nr:hypothetical protein [candidate division Zixibacteria bacterium]